jgi:hypothetical protein
MSDITKEELVAMMEVQSKTATAMENIANSIRQVSEQNKELVKLQSDIVKNFQEEREKCTAQICITLKGGIETATKEASANKATIEKIRDDTFWLKVILGSATLIVAIVMVLTHFATHTK